MFLRNTSSHPDNEVRTLIEFAAEPYDLRRVCVNVKGTRHAYRGRAYPSVPRDYSNAPRTAKRLVVIAVGKAELFATPISNVRTPHGWTRVNEEFVATHKPRHLRTVVNATGTYFEAWGPVGEGVPYGGKKSPVVIFNDWREAMIGVAAHEFHHIQQFQNKARIVEAYCERAAALALERYRTQKEGAGSAIIPAPHEVLYE